jgi:NADPH:quinone reductase-like Zn-dependent oxidoreductase
MRAAVLRQPGDPDVLMVEEVERPEPGDGEVLIKVRAAAVNPIDWKYRRGIYAKTLPAVLGSDISGTIEISRADDFAVGEDVFGFASTGAYAELATSSPGLIAGKPAGLSHEQAAALPVAGLTAWQALFDTAALQSGQSVLIAGAAGGVGHLAVQFAKRVGARVIGTGSTRNRDYVLALGADEYIDYTRQDVGEAVSGVDVAFDTVGGTTTSSLVQSLRQGGVLVTIAGAPPEDAARERGARVETLSMSPNPEQLAEIGELVASGEVRVEISEVLPLGDVARAHELSESGHVRGKIVLVM